MADKELEVSSSTRHGQEVVLPKTEQEVVPFTHSAQEVASPDPKQEVASSHDEQETAPSQPEQELEILHTEQNIQAQESVKEDEDKTSSNQMKDLTSVAMASPTGDIHQNVLNSLKEISDYCLVHKSEQITLFCKSCDRPVCSHCIIDGDHSNHKFCKVVDVVSSKESKMKEILQSHGEELSRYLQNKIKDIETQKEKVTENCQVMAAEIDSHKAKLALEVERWSENLQSSLTGHLHTHTQCLDSQMVQLQTILSIIKMFSENPSSLQNRENKKLLELGLEMLHKSSDPSASPAIEKALVFTPREVCSHCKGRPYGHVTGLDIEVSDSDNMEAVMVPPGNIVATGTDNESTESDSKLKDELAVAEMRYKFRDKPIYRIAPIRNRTAYILSEDGLYLIDLNKAHEWTEKPKPLMTSVAHITPMTEHGIYVQTLYSTLIKRVTAQGNVYRFADVYSCPNHGLFQSQGLGIAKSGNVISCTEERFGCNLEKYSVNFYECDKDGVLVNEIYSEVCKLFSNQVCDIVNTKSAVFYLDAPFKSLNLNPRTDTGVVVNLQKQTKYHGIIGNTPASQFYPRGMCQDEADHLIVSDFWNHAVHQLTPEGQFRKFLLREEDGLTHPIAVAMDTDNCLWIGQQDGTIHIINYVP